MDLDFLILVNFCRNEEFDIKQDYRYAGLVDCLSCSL